MRLSHLLVVLAVHAAALLTLSGTADAVVGDFMPERDEVRRQYRSLYEQSVTVGPDGTKRFGAASAIRYGGLNVVHLRGDVFEMAYQHGRLLKDDILAGVVPGAAKLVYNEATNLYGSTPRIRNVVYNVIDRRFFTKLLESALELAPGDGAQIRRTAFGISEATGLPLNTVFDAALAPSVLMLLAAQTTDTVESAPAFGPMSNCSEFAVWGERSATGNLLIARNTDYPLNGRYDDHHTVIYFDPTTEGAQKYTSIISAGAHNAGVAAINESGIYVGSHTVPTDAVSTEAVPAYFISQAVVANARTFDEALTIFRAVRAETGWTFVLASTREGRIASVEMNANGVAVRESQGQFHVQTNHYMTPEKEAENLSINQGIVGDSRSRYRRIDQLVRTSAPFDVTSAARVLADQVDADTGRTIGLPGTVAVMTTVTSFIIDPANETIHVANGPAPVPHNTYVALPLPGSFDMARLVATPVRQFANNGFGQAHPAKLQAIRAYIEGKKAYEYDNDPATAAAHMARAVVLDPETGAYRLGQAVMELKADEWERAGATLGALVVRGDASAHERHVGLWLRGRMLADKGDFESAGRDFQAIVDDPAADAKIKAAAEDGQAQLNGRRYALNAEKLPYMLQFADFQNYK